MKERIFNRYAEEIAERFNISVEDLLSNCTDRTITPYRHLLYFLCNHRMMSYTEIAKYMRNNGASTLHAAVLKGCRKYVILMEDDSDYYDVYQEIKEIVE